MADSTSWELCMEGQCNLFVFKVLHMQRLDALVHLGMKALGH